MDATAKKSIVANPYLLEEGPTMSLFTFLFEGLPGAGSPLSEDAPVAAQHAERLPF